MPAITPHPSKPATDGSAAGSTFVHWPACTSVFSANAPIPSAAVSGRPDSSVIGWDALWVSKQYHGRPRAQARHCPHTPASGAPGNSTVSGRTRSLPRDGPPGIRAAAADPPAGGPLTAERAGR